MTQQTEMRLLAAALRHLPLSCTVHRPPSTAHFSSFAARITQLTRSIETLAASAQRVGVGPPQGREWFDLLQRKLLPQLQGPPLLIVAIVGGTNIGKSVVFNHLAGETASAATPLAAGTKHPVCLVPPGCDDPQLLGRLFEHFELHAWQSADDPLDDAPDRSDLLAAGDAGAAAAGAGRCPGRRFRRDGELAAGPGDPPDGRRADCPADAAEIQRRGGEAVLPRGGRGRQADHRDLQFLRFGGRSRLLAAVAGPLLRRNGRRSGTGLRRALRSRRGRANCGCRFIG